MSSDFITSAPLPGAAASTPPSVANGRYSLGKSATTTHVRVTLDVQGVQFGDAAGARHTWPLDSLRATVPIGRSTDDLVLTTTTEPEAQLWVSDGVLVKELATYAPALKARTFRWRATWPGLVLSAIVAAGVGALWALNISPVNIAAQNIPAHVRVRFGENVIKSMTNNRRTCSAPAGEAALQTLTHKLTVHIPASSEFRVSVVDWNITNAFTAPGGQIIITRALIERAQSAEEVAGVLAHELGHAIERHPEAGIIRMLGLSAASELMLGGSSGSVGNVGLMLTQLSYSRDAEREADAHAFRLLRLARITPKGIAAFFHRMMKMQGENAGGAGRPFDIFSSHPATLERAELADRQPDFGEGPALSAEQWAQLRTICGVASPQPPTNTPPRTPSTSTSVTLPGVQANAPTPASEASGQSAAATALNQRGNIAAAARDPATAIRLYDQAIALDPRYAAAFYNRGLAYAATGNHQRALVDYDVAIAYAPRIASYYTARSIAYRVLGRSSDAIADATTAITLSQSALGFKARGLAYQAAGDHDRAITDFSSAITASTTDGETYFGRATSLAAKARYDDAIADFSTAWLRDPRNATALYGRGRAYAAKGDQDRAIADYSRAIGLDPQALATYLSRGNAYYAKSEFGVALADYNRALAIDPKNALAHKNKGNAHASLGMMDQAIADYSDAIRLDPRFAAAYGDRGTAYNGKGDAERAIADFDRAIALDPAPALVYNNRALTRFKLGQLDLAIADATRAIERNRSYAQAYVTRGNAHLANKTFEAALSDFTRALELNPKMSVAYNDRGNVLNAMGRFDPAIADFDKAIEFNASYALAFSNRGFARNGKGETEKAIEDYTHALTLAPKLTAAALNRARAFALRGDYELALADLTRVTEYEPGNAQAYRDRGFVNFAAGRYEAAGIDFSRHEPFTRDTATLVLRYVARARAGRRATDELQTQAAALEAAKTWPYAAAELMLGKRSPDATLDAAGRDLRCEALFYVGQYHLLDGQTSRAIAQLEAAKAVCSPNAPELGAVVAELKRLKAQAQ